MQWVNSASLLARRLLKFHKNSMRQLVSEINHKILSPSKLGTNCRICLNPGIKLFPLRKKAEIIYLNFATLQKTCIINKGHSACFVSSCQQYSLGIMKYCALFSKSKRYGETSKYCSFTSKWSCMGGQYRFFLLLLVLLMLILLNSSKVYCEV